MLPCVYDHTIVCRPPLSNLSNESFSFLNPDGLSFSRLWRSREAGPLRKVSIAIMTVFANLAFRSIEQSLPSSVRICTAWTFLQRTHAFAFSNVLRRWRVFAGS